MAVKTDETMHSQEKYGNPEFPFACIKDELEGYESRSIEWHWHNECEFSWVVQGTVKCCTANSSVILKSGDVLFINSGVMHRFESCERGALVNFIFSPEFIADEGSEIFDETVSPLINSDIEAAVCAKESAEEVHGGKEGNGPVARYEGGSPGIVLVAADDEISNYMENIYKIVISDRFGKKLSIRNEISKIWLMMAQIAAKRPDSGRGGENRASKVRLQKMISFIHENYHRKITLDEICAEVSVSKSEALRCFHAGIQMTPIKYLNEYRLKRAARELANTLDTVSRVAEKTGFESSGYFCRVFRGRYGMSPNEFRKKHIK